MKPRSMMYGLVGVILTTMMACVSLQSGRGSSSPSASPVPTASVATETPDSTSDRPDTKIITMNLEGRTTEVELKLYQHPSLPFVTYYPAKDFAPELEEFEEGTRIRFYFTPNGKKNEEMYLSCFIPQQSTSPDAILDLIMGENGLLVKNQWELVDRTNIVSYPWTVEKLIYQQPQESEMTIGSIYVGQAEGKAFYTLTHYPETESEKFEPKANILLENLQFGE